MRIMVAMSGGVDSSVAAALLHEQGHDVVGVTLKLWGGESDSGCCSVSDVDDARRVADGLGIEHHVFNFGDEFDRDVVEPYVDAHRVGLTPNPCIECNRHLKFERLTERADLLGFDAVATGHHVRLGERDGRLHLRRSSDPAKDQSYVLYVVDGSTLERVSFPVGDMTKDEVRAHAARVGLRTAAKPDSQDVCFITSGQGRAGFLAERMPSTPGVVVDTDGTEVGRVDAVELVTIGQRRGLAVGGFDTPRYAIDVDVTEARVTIGTATQLRVDSVRLRDVVWTHDPVVGHLVVQCSAHGRPVAATVETAGDAVSVRFDDPHRRLAPGQSVVFYDGDLVVGGGIVCRD